MTVAAIPIIATIASTVVSVAGTVYSAVQSSKAEKKTEHMMERQAALAQRAAAQKAEDYEKRARSALATERALRGASGITMEGTPLLTQYEHAKTAEEDIRRIKEGGEIEAGGWLQQAELHKMYGEQTRTGGLMRAGSTLLTGATDVFKQGQKVYGW